MSVDAIFKGDAGGTYDVSSRTVVGKEVQQVESPETGTLGNPVSIDVDDVGVELAAASAHRKALILYNRGGADCDIGTTGVAFVGGLLAVGERMTFSEPYCPTNTIVGVCDSGQSASILVLEVTG